LNNPGAVAQHVMARTRFWIISRAVAATHQNTGDKGEIAETVLKKRLPVSSYYHNTYINRFLEAYFKKASSKR